MSTITEIWRYPIKAIGRERVAQAALTPGQALPWDRTWAVAHEASAAEPASWSHCRNFIRAASSPQLMAISSQLESASETITLRHPDRPEITLHPERDAAQLIAWLAPLITPGRPAPAAVIRPKDRAMTDSGTAGLTLCNLASHRAVTQRLGRDLSRHRWRGNIWLDGLAPWEEFDWVDRELSLGTARLRVYGRTERCRATEANPETGQRDTDTLGVLRGWDHQDFSVKAEVIAAGEIREGDRLEVL